ncbi:Pkinase-fungal domain-containing protein [Mycena kentingensis (nom. inval.)]|nr:Pkinase-fungal domain-containing protein [Mycena kentingensis (nom. inval.)]
MHQETAFCFKQERGEVDVCMLHTMLGWLDMFQAGSLDHDLDAGSLLQRVQPIQTKAQILPRNPAPVKGQVSAAKIKGRLRELGVRFSITGDWECEWDNFDAWRSEARLNTYEFMSESLLWTIDDPQPYLYGPVDDLASAYFVTQWAAVNRYGDAEQNEELSRRIGTGYGERSLTTQIITSLDRPQYGRNRYSQFINYIGPSLNDCGDAEHSKLSLAFYTFAYRGVSDLIESILALPPYVTASPPATPPRSSKPTSIPKCTPMSRLRSVNSDDHGSSTPISQDDLKKVMADQIGGQTWQFPTEDFVRMICHKERRTDAQIAALKLPDDGFDRTSFYTHASDASAFKSALTQGCQALELQYASSGIAAQLDKPGLPEEKYYDPLAKLFNLFLKVAREKSGARGSVLSRNGPFSQLAFLEYNRPTADGIAGSAALKPDLVGVTDGNAIAQPGIHKVRAAISLYWSPPEGEHAIHIPFEVKDGWKALLRQAATYARALFNTHPLRTFVLVFGYDQVNHEFRALIFHRGGVSALHACDLSKPTGRAALFTILLALLTCQSEEDVGIPLWCNEQRIKLPARADCSIVDATITKILSSEVVCRGRATRVYRVAFPSSADPTPIPVLTPEQLLPESLLRRSTRFQPVSEGANNENTSRSEKTPKSANMKSNTSAPTSKTRGSTQVWTGAAISPAHNGRDLSELRVGDFSGAESWSVVEGDAVLKSTWAPAGASLEAEILAACSGLFGCPRHYYSFSPINAFGVPATNHLFLPPPDADLDAFHWDIFGNRTTLQPERRALLLILIMCVLHTMLGWLNLL